MGLLFLPILWLFRLINRLYRKMNPLSAEEVQARRYTDRGRVVTVQFGEGDKKPLTKDVEKFLRDQIYALQKADLTGYTYESHESVFQDARADLMVYDPSGKTYALGRDFAGRIVFWQSN